MSQPYQTSEAMKLAAMLNDLSVDESLRSRPSNQSLDSSLGLLKGDAMTDFADFDASKENLEPNISLGRYLQPAFDGSPLTAAETSVCSQPLSDSEEENEVALPTTVPTMLPSESFEFTPPAPVLPSQAVQQSPETPSFSDASINGFSWDKVVQANTADNDIDVSTPFQPEEFVPTNDQEPSCEDEWHKEIPDPSFCSGKFSARSTSFGGMNNTRDENFSDFSKVPSFQGSYVSTCSTNMEESIFKSGHVGQTQSNLFQGLDADSQAELGQEFGDNEFGSLGKDDLENFFEKEEEECLKENPFIEEEPCAAESPGNSSVMSGVSDKSIMLRNSNLWGGDTSKVDLDQLKKDTSATKLSRCEYFRHNSSRLGSLDDSVEEGDRPDLGFCHNIRSPERKPCALLSDSRSSPALSKHTSLSGTFNVEAAKNAPAQEETEEESPPSSANTTYMASGNSTKTVVSLMDNTDTLKAAELVTKLQSLAEQISGAGVSSGPSVSYPDVVEDSICSNTSKLEESIRETLEQGADINISTISKVLSEASISSDPQHFVNVILGCLKSRANNDQGAAAAMPLSTDLETETDQSVASNDSSRKISFCEVEPRSIKSYENIKTPKTSATLPRTGRSSTTPTGRLSHTPTSKMTSTESRRAMLRLTPSSAGPMPRTIRSSNSKPIKPFAVNTPHQVAPVKPQVASAPNSARSTPTPPQLAKSESFPSSLNSSGRQSSGSRQRRLSGTRHSSPIKKVQIQSPPARSLASTPTSDELSRLLHMSETPHLQIAAASHLATSTPFHGNNLSYVKLDHLTMNTSVSPLVNPDTSLCPVNLDVSTISPALYTSVLNTVREPKRVSKVEIEDDWSFPTIMPSHTKFIVSIPVKHNISSYCNCVVKMTNMWVGSCEVPQEHWDLLVSTAKESLVLLESGADTIQLEFTMMKEGAFTFNVGLMLDNGQSTSGLVRIQIEDPNIQVLTSDGNKIDFGMLPVDCEDCSEMMLVNCGKANIELYLELKQPSHFFTFDDGSLEKNVSLPGVEGSANEHGSGVGKELKIKVNTKGLNLAEAIVYRTELHIILGSNRDGTLLGSVPINVKVGNAKLVFKRGEEILQFSSTDVGASKNIVLRNVGCIPLFLKCTIESSDPNAQGMFKLAKSKVQVPANTSSSLPVSFMKKVQSSAQQFLVVQINPNGLSYSVLLKPPSALPSNLQGSGSKPGLSFGVMKKNPALDSSTSSVSSLELLTVFPVESDRSLVNFFCVGVGSTEQQSLALRNSTPENIVLTLIIRETDSFCFVDGSNNQQISFEPHQTKEVTVAYKPRKQGTDQGKLVLKPQGKKLGGKSFKASIVLCGVSGAADIIMEAVEEGHDNIYHINFSDANMKHLMTFSNLGNMTGFVKVIAEGAATNFLDISPTNFILTPKSRKHVAVSLIGDPDTSMKMTVIHGSELVRQVMKKARKLPGAARLCESSATGGLNCVEEFPGEAKEDFGGQLTAMDVKHFFKKMKRETIELRIPSKPVEFDQLSVEETLSETRIDQSIALPLHTTNIHRNMEKNACASLIPSPLSPPTTDQEDASIKIIPDRINLKSGGETLLKMINLSNNKVHWDMSWPSSKLTLDPGSGILEAGGEAMVCVEAAHGGQSWRGQIQTYTDNNVINIDVTLSGDQQVKTPPSPVIVSSKQLEFPTTMLGQASNSSLTLTNTSGSLAQWRAVMEPSFFSIVQSAGLLNPGQSVSVGVMFRPAATGQHSASLAVSSVSVRGDRVDTGHNTAPVTVILKGAASLKVDPNSGSGSKPKTLSTAGKRLGSGTVSLEKDVIIFPTVKVGELSIAKVKIENRSGSDKMVEIIPHSPSPFRTVHSKVEVKNRCFSTVPVHFQPTSPGEHSIVLMIKFEGNILSATLQGKAV